VGELVLFLENVRNVCKSGSSKSAFRLKAQSSRESTAWASALDSAITQATAARMPPNAAFVAENIFDKYKQTEEYRHSQQIQIHSAVSAKSGNESTTSSAVQSQLGHTVSANTITPLQLPTDVSEKVLFLCFSGTHMRLVSILMTFFSVSPHFIFAVCKQDSRRNRLCVAQVLHSPSL
jgi:hypothetical protein